jgi:hypothetical protein
VQNVGNGALFLLRLPAVRGCALAGQADVHAGGGRLAAHESAGSYALIEAIRTAIDDYAEREMGNREYFWKRPHKAG